MSRPTQSWRLEGIGDEQLEGYEIRVHAGPPPLRVELACRVCGGVVVVDEALRPDVVLGAIASGGALAGHAFDCPRVRESR